MSGNHNGSRAPKAPQGKASAAPTAALCSSGRALRRLTSSSSIPGGPSTSLSLSGRHAAAAAKYWRAVCDTNVFHAPFGRPVGDVEEGTVVEEGMRVVDCFDDMWIAVQADDGEVMWIRRYAAGALTDAKDAEWEPVVEGPTSAAAPSTPPAPGTLELDIAPLSIEDNVMDHALSLVTPEASLLEHYWTNIEPHQRTTAKDWNHHFQDAVEDILYKSTGADHDSRAHLSSLVSSFADVVEDACATIVREMFIKSSERTIQRHPSALDTYYHNGIMLRLCVDTSGGVYGGDRNAIKVANQLNKTIQQLLSVSPLYMISVPLAVVMTTSGYRITATTIPPVRGDRLLLGDYQGKQGRCHGTQQFPVKAMSTLGRRLGLKLHTYRDGSQGFFPVDAQLFAGLDHRLYLLNTGRIFPPAAPSSRCTSYHPLTSPLFQRLRPEIVERCGRALNPDAFYPGCAIPDDNEEIATISQWLRDEGIPTVAAVIGMHEPVEHPEQEDTTCCSCNRDISNELRFVVCRQQGGCEGCCICTQCNLDLLQLDVLENKSEEAQAKYEKIPLKCSASSSRRGLHGLVLQPSVTTIFHANCVNMRYLPFVYHRLPESAALCTSKYLEIEMIARSAKHLLWQKLRTTQGTDEVRDVCGKFFVGLLQPAGEMAEAFWSKELGPMIQNQFDIYAPFNTTNMDIDLVYTRVSELTGVELTDASIASFSTDQPFVQVHRIHPVMKTLHIPQLVETVGQHESALRGTLEELLLFWIGMEDTEEAVWVDKYPSFTKERF